MITLMKLKQELRFSQDLGDITDVLKSTALIQFRLFQLKDKPSQDFFKELEKYLRLLKSQSINHPYFLDRENLPTVLVVVTSDEGFLGELNTLLVNTCLDQRKSGNDEIIVLGERGARYLEDAKEKFVSFPGISHNVNLNEAEDLRSYLLKVFRQRRFGRVLIFYPEFLSLTAQKVTKFQLLPLLSPPEQASESEEKILSEAAFIEELEDLLIEPSLNRVLDALVSLWLGARLLHMFWSAKQSEFAARIMHLEGSTQELSHLNRRLAFEYFRQVHALNDKTIREISASKILLGAKRN